MGVPVREKARVGLLPAALLCVLPAVLAAQEEETVMTDTRDRLIAELLTLDGTAAYLFPDGERLRAIARRVGEYGKFEGFAVTCPPRLGAADGHLPVLLLSVLPASDPLPGRTNYVLVLTPLAQGRVSLGSYFPPPPRWKNVPRTGEIPADPEAPPEDPGQGPRETGVCVENVGARLAFPITPGPYAIRLLAFERASNAFRLELTPPGGEPAPQEPYTLEDAARVHLDRTEESPPLPTFTAGPSSPGVPGELGVALALPPEVGPGEEPVPVFGSFKVTAPPGALVRAAFADPAVAGDRDPVALAATLPRAILEGVLVFTREGVVDPPRIALDLPVYADRDLQVGDTLQGSFGLDLRARLRLAPGVYNAWLIVGEHADGPHQVVVAPEGE